MANAVSKQDRVIKYLFSGKTLSQNSADTIFGVANLRATISDIKPIINSKGFSVVKSVGRQGETRYGIISKKVFKKNK